MKTDIMHKGSVIEFIEVKESNIAEKYLGVKEEEDE